MVSDKIKILISTPYSIFGEGIRTLFDTKTNIVVIGEVRNSLDLINRLYREVPDIVIVDMDDTNAMGIISAIKSKYKGVKIIPISDNVNEEVVFSAMRNGCSTYLKKDIDLAELYDAVMSCHYYNFYVNQITSPVFFREMNEYHPAQKMVDLFSFRIRFKRWWEKYGNSIIKGTTIGLISGLLICLFLFLMIYFNKL